ncbi:MAG: aromatic-ring-hydroxylating dioxygenase subunit beta [Deltaproteobacteria bacterium]|nr:aromatic-ring-hydroxylating dioxygenase subunit beta [Deltaproteobacteria bacterium]
MSERLLLRLELEELNAAYAAALDEDALEQWPELFVADATYRIVPRDDFERGLPLAVMHCESRAMLEDRVAALRRASVYAPRALRHLISGVRMQRIDGAVIHAAASYAVLQTLPEELTTVFSAGRYLDEVVREDGVLKFRSRIVVFDSVLVPGSLVYPL